MSLVGLLTAVNQQPTDGDDDHFWQLQFGRIISGSYLTLCLLSAIQLLRTILNRHKLLSFRAGFLSVCFLWTLLRVIFWFVVSLRDWPVWAAVAIYFLPSACQIATFSLLVLFFAKLVHRHKWRGLRSVFISFCVLANLAMIVLTLLFAAFLDKMASLPGEDDISEATLMLTKMYYICSSIFFGMISGLAAYYLHRLHQFRGPATSGTNPQELVVTALVFLLFLTRCVSDLLAAFDSFSAYFRHQIFETADHTKLLEGSTFVLIFLWEIAPTMLVLVYFRTIPRTQSSLCPAFLEDCDWSGCPCACCQRKSTSPNSDAHDADGSNSSVANDRHYFDVMDDEVDLLGSVGDLDHHDSLLAHGPGPLPAVGSDSPLEYSGSGRGGGYGDYPSAAMQRGNHPVQIGSRALLSRHSTEVDALSRDPRGALLYDPSMSSYSS